VLDYLRREVLELEVKFSFSVKVSTVKPPLEQILRARRGLVAAARLSGGTAVRPLATMALMAYCATRGLAAVISAI
jgi:hypothetical protein